MPSPTYAAVVAKTPPRPMPQDDICNDNDHGGTDGALQIMSSIVKNKNDASSDIDTGTTDDSSTGILHASQKLKHVLQSTLPLDEDPNNIVLAFGYGSGIFSQTMSHETTQEEKLMDVIVVVKDAHAFHRHNVQWNPSHYWIPPGIVASNLDKAAAWCTRWQRHPPSFSWLGRNPGVYFLLSKRLKYGVVQIEDLQDDLQHWSYLYLAGRMQKPILPILENEASSSIRQLQESINLPAALATALLLLPNDPQKQHVSVSQDTNTACMEATSTAVFRQIASLSYLGDFRVQWGAEDPQKVTRLVQGPGQFQRFQDLYADAAHSLQQAGILSCEQGPQSSKDGDCGATKWTWDTSPTATEFLYQYLPKKLQNATTSKALQCQLAGIIAPAARYQSFKGIVTAGPIKAWHYAARKLSKGLLRR